MSFSTTQRKYKYNSIDTDNTDDTKECDYRAPPEALGPMSMSPRTNINNVENEVNCVMNELVSSLKEIGPAIKMMQQLLPAIAAMREELRTSLDLMEAQTQLFTTQTRVLTQLSDKLVELDKRLDQQQKSLDELEQLMSLALGENHEARLKKLEELFESNKLTPPTSDKEANATAPESRPIPILISEAATNPMPIPTPSSTRALSVGVPTGWSKLSEPARELLRQATFDHLKRSHVLRGAIGTSTLQ